MPIHIARSLTTLSASSSFKCALAVLNAAITMFPFGSEFRKSVSVVHFTSQNVLNLINGISTTLAVIF